MAKRKSNKEFGKRATNSIIAIAASVGAEKGIEALSMAPFMQDEIIKIAAPGGLTALGFAGSILPENEMIRAAALGIASGAANKTTDAALSKFGMAGLGSASVADDYLDLYTNDSGIEGVEDYSIRGVSDLVIK